MKERKESDWKPIISLIEKLSEEADRLDWPELIDMVSSSYDEMEKEKDPATILFTWQQFFFRLLYRVRRFSSPLEFNLIYKTNRLENHDNVEMYQITNYDCKMFLWSRKKGFNEYITNDYILVPIDKLTEKEKESFEKKCKNSY